jgi:hypothetical protein
MTDNRNTGSLLCFQIEHNVLFNLMTEEQQMQAWKRMKEAGVDFHYQKEVPTLS